MSRDPRVKKILLVSIRNIGLNSVLSAIKIVVGLTAGSLAVLSDGLNSLSDVATAVVVLVGSHFTREEHDEEHQYGHEKIESIITLLIALFLCAVALFTVYESVLRFIHRSPVSFSYFALGAVLLSAVVKVYMSLSTRKAARETESDSLALVAADYGFDVLLSLSVFAGVLLAMLGLWYFEPIAAIAASAILIKSMSIFLVRAFNQLADKSTDPGTARKITLAVLECEGIRHVDVLMTRQHGNRMYVDIEISVDPMLNVLESHNIAQSVHDRLESDAELKIKHCMVHVNPDIEGHG